MEMHNMWGGKLSCGHCDDKFSSDGLKRHMISVNGVKRQCPECKYFYANVYSHIRRFHKREGRLKLKSVSCKTQCKNEGGDASQKHKCKFTKKSAVQTECGLCQKLLSISVFNDHLKKEHIHDIANGLNILDDIETRNIEKMEEIAEIFVLTQFYKSGNKNVCKLCSQEVKKYMNTMTNHMKHHLGFTLCQRLSKV